MSDCSLKMAASTAFNSRSEVNIEINSSLIDGFHGSDASDLSYKRHTMLFNTQIDEQI